MNDSFSQELSWLLKEKYHWSEAQVQQAVQSSDFPKEVQKDINRLHQGEPVAYVIGWAPFLGLKIDLSQKTLIPRPETEYWVELFLKKQQHLSQSEVKVLDLCCGSGCIGLSVLKEWPKSTVDFVDLEQRAIDQTRLNLHQNNFLQERWQLIQSNLFDAVADHYDFILTNPPYVDPFGDFSPLLAYEPKESLFAQKNGIELIEEIILNAKKHLKIEGEVWLEFGETQAEEVKKLAKEAGCTVEIFSDQFEKDRFAVLTAPTSHPQN